MSVINFSALPKDVQLDVTAWRNKTPGRPVYVRRLRTGWELRQVLSIYPVGSEDYGYFERIIELAGYKMVIGKGSLEALRENKRQNPKD